MRKAILAALIATTSVAVARGAGTPSSDTRVPSPEQARVLEGVNARRRAARLKPLEWEPALASVLREVFRGATRPADKAIDAGLERSLGYDPSWTWSSRGVEDVAEAAAEMGSELLGRDFTHAAVGMFDDLGVAGMRRVVVLAIQVPPLFGRRNANGPAGSYRFRCPSCRHEVVYSLASPRWNSNFDCPICKSRLVPYIEDMKGALHWPTWYVTPFAPFATTNPFLAWQWVNQKVRYDYRKKNEDQPGWQTAQETNDLGSGVCRDTAVMLAAWLRHADKDVRVVTGLDPTGQAHAWVILKDGETRYLLESAFDGSMTRRYPPRLELAKYIPNEMQFDDTRVWLNRGQQRTQDYDTPSIWFTAEEAP